MHNFINESIYVRIYGLGPSPARPREEDEPDKRGPPGGDKGGGHAGLGQERNGPASWAAGKKRKENGEEGKSWAGPKTREREKSFEIKIKQI